MTSRLLLRKQVQALLPHEFHGTQYGGWAIAPEGLTDQSIIYSLGVGEDVSFDLSLIKAYGVQVFAFDPTPRSIEWVKQQSLPPQFHFFEYGVADYDGIARFYIPEDANYVSHTLLSTMDIGNDYMEVPIHRLQTMMETLKHTTIDVLKMDIEGAEYAVINDMLKSNLRPHQLLIEFHHRLLPMGAWKTYRALRKLEAANYDVFCISPNGNEYSFIER